MALQNSYTDGANHTDATAYHRVVRPGLDYEEGRAIIDVITHKTKADRDATPIKDPVIKRQYVASGAVFTTWFAHSVLDVLNQNPTERAYEYLLSVEAEFSGATDV